MLSLDRPEKEDGLIMTMENQYFSEVINCLYVTLKWSTREIRKMYSIWQINIKMLTTILKKLFQLIVGRLLVTPVTILIQSILLTERRK